MAQYMMELGAFGDYASAADALFDAMMKAGGVSGNALRAGLQKLVPIAKAASDTDKWPFMYEVEKRPELQTDAAVPDWLLVQLRDRVKAVVASSKKRGEAEAILRALRPSLSVKSASAPPLSPDKPLPAPPPSKPFPWVWVIGGAAVVGLGAWWWMRRKRRAAAAPVQGLRRRRRR